MARKILLADDSVTAQNMGRRILTDAGYDVTTVNNGSAALKRIAESKPDLIVLDVYMPGYGGLEVCQRLREAPETARIPVLLTVGKLEPFKADEARRVRADGFIVKPFEASELLTALTKLEDKIVPQSQPSRQSRFAKALAGIEEPNPSKEFGDSETGWKNRLSIPPPPSKHRESAPEETSAVVASLREAVRSEEPRAAEMKSGLEEALLSSMPQDVTAEEIAAIKAAAAAFSAPGNESNFRQSHDQAETKTQQPVENAGERKSEFAGSENPSDVAQVEASAEEATAAVPVSELNAPIELAPIAAIVSESAATTASPDPGAGAGKLGDDEVTAALASLAPANGHGDSAAIDQPGNKWDLASRDQVPVTMAVGGATQEFSGPRWIAEPVALLDDEATLVLEQEMEKAYAAFAAADAARMSFASRADEVPSAVADTPATSSESVPCPVDSSSNSDGFEPTPPEPAMQASAEESQVPAAAPSSEAAPSTVDTVSESTVSPVEESAAYAAAASASAGTNEVTTNAEATTQLAPSAETSDNVPLASAPHGREGESELAAAWANWKQVRESVIGSQLSSQLAETVAEIKESSSETQPEPQADASSATEEETSDISNIVDSVLADLKPKLMAEIAKKMGKEKKK
ncbi:MAG TPA: response regulator [Terriglobales bacterium]|nr:response regulator [Terriglobales bacterium]